MKDDDKRDLEAERTELLAVLRQLVPAELQREIAQAISIAAQAREVLVKTSHSGAANADPQ